MAILIGRAVSATKSLARPCNTLGILKKALYPPVRIVLRAPMMRNSLGYVSSVPEWTTAAWRT
jgi:uncharacterized membrane protein